jgi:hypothetical protein
MADPKDNRDEEVAKSIAYTLELVSSRKPNDRSAQDRVYAVTKTDLEKVYAYFIVGIAAVNEYGRHLQEVEEAKKEA